MGQGVDNGAGEVQVSNRVRGRAVPPEAPDLRALHLVQANDNGRQHGLGGQRQPELDGSEATVACFQDVGEEVDRRGHDRQLADCQGRLPSCAGYAAYPATAF
jgi:hypothetical protein